MKKFYPLKIFLKSLLFAACLFWGAWIFMPWRQIGEAVLLSASENMPGGASLAFSGVEDAGNGFTVRNLEVRNLMGMVNMSFGTLTVVPDAAGSLLGMAPACRLAFTGAVVGDVAVTPLRKIPGVAPGSGRVTASVSDQGIFLDELRSDGELSMMGSLLVNPSAQRIVWADVAMDIKSRAFEENLPALVSVSGLPLQQEGPGRWLLRRPRGGEPRGGE